MATGEIHSVPLTERGRSEAEAAGKALSHVTFDRAVCSGLPRTQRDGGDRSVAASRMRPRSRSMPTWSNCAAARCRRCKSREELIAAMNAYFARAHEPGATNHEGGEVFAAAQARAVRGDRAAARSEPDWHTALVVAHEGINRAAAQLGLRRRADGDEFVRAGHRLRQHHRLRSGGAGGVRRALIKAVNLTPLQLSQARHESDEPRSHHRAQRRPRRTSLFTLSPSSARGVQSYARCWRRFVAVLGVEPGNAALRPDVHRRLDDRRIVERDDVHAERVLAVAAKDELRAALAAEFARARRR